MAIRIQLRRGTAAEWQAVDPILAAAEAGFERDTGKLKFGDGVTAWNSLEYAAMTPAEVAAAIADAVGDPTPEATAATPDTLVLRDGSGRAKIAAPSASDDIARKAEVDTHAALTNPHSATSLATASRLVLRDGSGRARFATPSNVDDAATKGYVDDAVSGAAGPHIEAKAVAFGGSSTASVTWGTAFATTPVIGAGVDGAGNIMDWVVASRSTTGATMQRSGAASGVVAMFIAMEAT